MKIDIANKPTLGEVEVLWFDEFHLDVVHLGAQFTGIHDILKELIVQILVPHLCVKHLELCAGMAVGLLGVGAHL